MRTHPSSLHPTGTYPSHLKGRVGSRLRTLAAPYEYQLEEYERLVRFLQKLPALRACIFCLSLPAPT
jgi:hypothetical protein